MSELQHKSRQVYSDVTPLYSVEFIPRIAALTMQVLDFFFMSLHRGVMKKAEPMERKLGEFSTLSS